MHACPTDHDVWVDAHTNRAIDVLRISLGTDRHSVLSPVQQKQTSTQILRQECNITRNSVIALTNRKTPVCNIQWHGYPPKNTPLPHTRYTPKFGRFMSKGMNISREFPQNWDGVPPQPLTNTPSHMGCRAKFDRC